MTALESRITGPPVTDPQLLTHEGLSLLFADRIV
jgi:hypothetical protein